MHIPTCPSQALDILSFAQAQIPTNDDFDRDSWLYIPDHYAEYRYLLGTKGANHSFVLASTPRPLRRGPWTTP